MPPKFLFAPAAAFMLAAILFTSVHADPPEPATGPTRSRSWAMLP